MIVVVMLCRVSFVGVDRAVMVSHAQARGHGRESLYRNREGNR